jgi:ABC-type branched-subunit amino acid transport system substrate-binding protein
MVWVLVLLASVAHSVNLTIGFISPFTGPTSQAWLATSGYYASLTAINVFHESNISSAYNVTVKLVDKDSYLKNIPTSVAQSIVKTKELIDQGIIGLIGDAISEQTIQNALITSQLKIPQCSFASGSSTLNDRTKYPLFYRPFNSWNAQCNSFFPFIKQMGWQRVALIYSDNSLNTGVVPSFMKAASLYDISVDAVIGVQVMTVPSRAYYGKIAKQIYEKDLRILVMVGSQQTIAPVLLEYHLSGYNVSDLTILSSQSFLVDLYNTMIIWLNNTVDPLTGKNTTWNNEDITQYAYRLYDGVFASASASQSLDSHFTTAWANMTDKYRHLRAAVNVVSAYNCLSSMISGFIKLAESLPGDPAKNLQDIADHKYKNLMSLEWFNNSKSTAFKSFVLDDEGNFRANFRIFVFNGYNLSDPKYDTVQTVNSAGSIVFSDTVYFRRGGPIPSDHSLSRSQNIKYQSVPGIIIITICGLSTLFVLATLFMVVRNIKQPFIRNTIPVIHIIRLLSLILVCISIAISLGEPTKQICVSITFTQYCGFSLFMIATLIKNYKLYKMSSMSNSKVSFETKRILLQIFTSVAVLGIPYIVVYFVDPPLPAKSYISRNVYQVSCVTGSGLDFRVQSAVFFVLISTSLISLFFSYRLLNNPPVLQDQRIFTTLINIFVVGSLFIPLYLSNSTTFTENFATIILVFKLYMVSTTIFILFAPLLVSSWHTILQQPKSKNPNVDFSIFNEQQSFWHMREINERTNGRSFHAQGSFFFNHRNAFINLLCGRWYSCSIFKPLNDRHLVLINHNNDEALILDIKHVKLHQDTNVPASGTKSNWQMFGQGGLNSAILSIQYKESQIDIQLSGSRLKEQLEDQIINWNEEEYEEPTSTILETRENEQ